MYINGLEVNGAPDTQDVNISSGSEGGSFTIVGLTRSGIESRER